MALEEKIDCASRRYYTGYKRWEKIAIYAGGALAAGYLTLLGFYASCADKPNLEKPQIESVQQK